MSASTILGFSGDILTFAGGFVLSLDALWRKNEFRKTTDTQKVVARLSGINLTQQGLRLFDNNSVELVFIRRSVHRALWGTAIISTGFLCLLATRIVELFSH
jgi:hypothetical protein